MIVSGPTRPRRIFTCHGDGAAAIPIDPLHLGFWDAGASYVRVDPELNEIYIISRSPFSGSRRVGRVCLAPAVEHRTQHGTSSCRDVEPPEPYRHPVDRPARPRLLAYAMKLASGIQVRDAALSLVIEGFHEHPRYGGESCRVRVEHTHGGRGSFVIRRSFGEAWLEDFADAIPSAVIEIVRDEFARVKESEER